MITVGKWRYVLLVGLPVAATAVLVNMKKVQLVFPGEAVLQFSGETAQVDADLQLFRQKRTPDITFDRIPNQPSQVVVRATGALPQETVDHLRAAAKSAIDLAKVQQKNSYLKASDEYQVQKTALEARFTQLEASRNALLIGGQKRAPRAAILEKVEALKSRRRQLIDNYPTHADIPLLAKEIQGLLAQTKSASVPVDKIVAFDRQLVETKVRIDYFSRLIRERAAAAQTLKPLWTLREPVVLPRRPSNVTGLSLLLIVYGGVAFVLLGLMIVERRHKTRQELPLDGLWPTAKAEKTPEVIKEEPVAVPPADKPVALEVVSPELPSDPVTEAAASLYARWMEVAKVLYTPSSVPPEGVLDSVGPLLQESSEFLPNGHDVLARYLARSVEPGNLPAHVARTVLMALTGAEEAGVSAEHRLAMALAALFHDLAVVPRPAAQQDEVGSEVGRLSAVLLRRIPGLQPALLSMVEDILIGMDEFKLDTWQNVSQTKSLEPLSKVLREIDRFEKVMQKQKSRMTRQLKSANS